MFFTRKERNVILFVAAAVLLGGVWFVIKRYVLGYAPITLEKNKSDQSEVAQYEPEAEEPVSEPVIQSEEDVIPQKLNINEASVEEIASLPYIGESKAREIVRYRNENGPFKNKADLVKVKGIGEKLLEKIETYIEL